MSQKTNFKKIVSLGALPGIKTILLSPEEAIEKVNNGFDGMKVFLIIQYPSEALFLVEKGAKINHINLGTSMIHPGDKTYIIRSTRSTAVPIPEGDVPVWKKLHELGVKLTVQQVPVDLSIDLNQKIEDGLFDK
jgi:mannose/fructose/N-acetylgalactosamine-specific phosphotransferase system component IIB